MVVRDWIWDIFRREYRQDPDRLGVEYGRKEGLKGNFKDLASATRRID